MSFAPDRIGSKNNNRPNSTRGSFLFTGSGLSARRTIAGKLRWSPPSPTAPAVFSSPEKSAFAGQVPRATMPAASRIARRSSNRGHLRLPVLDHDSGMAPLTSTRFGEAAVMLGPSLICWLRANPKKLEKRKDYILTELDVKDEC